MQIENQQLLTNLEYAVEEAVNTGVRPNDFLKLIPEMWERACRDKQQCDAKEFTRLLKEVK